jgi:hypothetical protein
VLLRFERTLWTLELVTQDFDRVQLEHGHTCGTVSTTFCCLIDFRLIHSLHVSLIERRWMYGAGHRRDEFNVVFFFVVRA